LPRQKSESAALHPRIEDTGPGGNDESHTGCCVAETNEARDDLLLGFFQSLRMDACHIAHVVICSELSGGFENVLARFLRIAGRVVIETEIQVRVEESSAKFILR